MQSYKPFEFSMVRNGRAPEQIVGRTRRQREGAGSLGARYKGEEHTALCPSWDNCRTLAKPWVAKECGVSRGPTLTHVHELTPS